MSGMGMQRGFGATPDMAPAPNQGDPLIGSSIFHISAEEGKNRRTTILLDDEPVWGYRHKIKRPYTPGKPSGDWRERDIRLTCAVPHDKNDQPRSCLACEAAIRNGDIIKRNFTANLTCIDVGEHRTKRGQVYHDLKKMVELDWAAYETFREQKKALGSLVGMAFSVMRPTGDPKQSKTFGMWTPLQRVNLVQHFWSSSAVRSIMEMAQKRGERITQQDAVTRLISPIDYGKELNNYTPALAERFVMRAVSRAGSSASDDAGGFQSSPPAGFGGPPPGFQGAPQGFGQGQGQPGFPQGPQGPQGFQGAQTMSPAAAPDFSVQPQQPQQPMGGMPPQGFQQNPQNPQGFPGGQPQAGQFPQQGMMSQGFPQGAPQGFNGNGGGSVPPPPQGVTPAQHQPQQFGGPQPVGNPMGATMPPGMSMPPQQGQQQPTLAPWAGQQPTLGQPQMPQQQMAPQQGGPVMPQGGGYGFESSPGWQQQFPQGAPQGQMPQQGQMQPAPAPQQMPQGQPQAAPQQAMGFPSRPSGLPF